MTITRRSLGTTPIKAIGYAANRTSLVIYNNSANIVYWANSRDMCQEGSGFPIKSGVSFSLKIPEDDPRPEIWLVANVAASDTAIYEGYG